MGIFDSDYLFSGVFDNRHNPIFEHSGEEIAFSNDIYANVYRYMQFLLSVTVKQAHYLNETSARPD